MEYNRSKNVLEKIAGIFEIISASMYMLLSLLVIIAGIFWGWLVIGVGMVMLTLAILKLIFAIKLVKSPYLPNGEIRNKQAARVWVLVLSILTCEVLTMGLMIAVLCLKDLKPSVSNSVQNCNKQDDQAKFYDFYSKIQEVKKLKSLGVIEDVTYKKAITKIVADLIKE